MPVTDHRGPAPTRYEGLLGDLDGVRRAVAEFRAALDSVTWIGASRTAELARLRVLVRRYPEDARNFLAELAREGPGDGE